MVLFKNIEKRKSYYRRAVNDFGPKCDSELLTPKRYHEITKINLPATLVDLETSLNIPGLCIFHAESNGSIYFALSIETKELYRRFFIILVVAISHAQHHPVTKINFFTKFCGYVYLFRITHNPKNVDPNFEGHAPSLNWRYRVGPSED